MTLPLVALVPDIVNSFFKCLNGSFPSLFYTSTRKITTLLYAPCLGMKKYSFRVEPPRVVHYRE